jgi:hypothetical protein
MEGGEGMEGGEVVKGGEVKEGAKMDLIFCLKAMSGSNSCRRVGCVRTTIPT